MRKMTNQWLQCATKAKHEDIQKVFTDKVRSIKSGDIDPWKDLVHNIEIYNMLKVSPKVHGERKAKQRVGETNEERWVTVDWQA